MTRPSLPALSCLMPLVLLSGCAAQMGGGSSDRRYEDLRGLVLEQRRAIEDLRREQEFVRATLDQLQYGVEKNSVRNRLGPGGTGVPTPPVNEGSYWGRPLAPTVEPVPGSAAPGAPIGPGAPVGDALASTGEAPAPPAPPPAPKPAASEPEKGKVPQDLVGSSYDSAMRQLQGGDHDEAIQSFRNYLHENGSSPYADDAQFWIGESYFRKGQYHRAIIEFNQVSSNYGSGDRAPAALLRQAEAFRIVGDRVDARLSLQKVINRYPGTGEAAKASKMLSEIGG
jgi:tol-pal system protein YbgF